MVIKGVHGGNGVAQESGVGILCHMVTKRVNRRSGQRVWSWHPVAQESGVGILGHMFTEGVNRRNGVAKESGVGILGHM
eukprot:1746669-Karenia_brevis.AAC.1